QSRRRFYAKGIQDEFHG
ncbi:hypothetical protein Tco_0677291, partial [Tanacetum coccineum]